MNIAVHSADVRACWAVIVPERLFHHIIVCAAEPSCELPETPGITQFECKGDAPHERGCRMAGVWYDTRKQLFIVEPEEALGGMSSETCDKHVLDSLCAPLYSFVHP